MNVVYFLQAGNDGPVKIGRTTIESLQRRISTMQCGNPEPLLLRALYHFSDEGSERRVHSIFRGFRFTGEWFTPAVLEHLNLVDLRPIPIDHEAESRKHALHYLRRRAAGQTLQGAPPRP